ncbi:MAG: glycosyltransferase family 2 protein [Bdellovibrionota bacterium]
MARFYDSRCRPYLNGLIAAELNRGARFYDSVLQLRPLPSDEGKLLALIENPNRASCTELPLSESENQRRLIFLNGTFNHDPDAATLLGSLYPKMARGDRVAALVYNSYWRWLYRFFNYLGIRQGSLPISFLTRADILSISSLACFEVTRSRPVAFFPFRLMGMGDFLNRLLAATPILRWTGFSEVVILRPRRRSAQASSISVIIPARNERGNIRGALERLPDFGVKCEVIFVEGHSRDGTWDEICLLRKEFAPRIDISAFRQPGIGKADAVREGLRNARHELIAILDADLTVPPEQLLLFHRAFQNGAADFVNGNRLIYPMEGGAMRFLNWIGNQLFARMLSFVLDCQLGDTLCGTKLFLRSDYARFLRWRDRFGDFDPFGDFELLFPAAELGLGIVDIPVRYGARSYGATSIRRFTHGIRLLRMVGWGLWKIRMGSAAA